MNLSRRAFLGAAGVGALAACASRPGRPGAGQPAFNMSLAQWSLHRALKSGAMDNLEFAPAARREYGIDAVEYVNSFFKDRARDEKYLDQMKQRAADHGVASRLIMIDGEGDLGDPDGGARSAAVENHRRWVDAAAHLGCTIIRVNAASRGSFDEQQRLAADGLRRLAEYGDTRNIDVIVENHGGLSSNGRWLMGALMLAGHPRLGTLPDFGNFRISSAEEYDRYTGVAEMMPLARAVSAKSYDFDAGGRETTIDYDRMMRIVVGAGYRGYVGIEYEGERLSEPDGIRATRALLERIRAELA